MGRQDRHSVLPLLFRGLAGLTMIRTPRLTEDWEVSTFLKMCFLACKCHVGNKEETFYNNFLRNHSSETTLIISGYMKLNIFSFIDKILSAYWGWGEGSHSVS